MLALSSTDAWMENMIKKKEKKGKVTEMLSIPSRISFLFLYLIVLDIFVYFQGSLLHNHVCL